jgi:hypothetical protein
VCVCVCDGKWESVNTVSIMGGMQGESGS